MRKVRTHVALVLGAALAAFAWTNVVSAQDPFDDDGPKVELVSAEPASQTVPAGETAGVALKVRMADGWHTYGLAQIEGVIPTSVSVASWPAGLSFSDLTESPEAAAEEFFGDEMLVHHGEFTLTLAVAVAPDAEPGPRTLEGAVTIQACDESVCLPPEELSFSVTVDVEQPEVALVSAIAEPARVAPRGSAMLRLTTRLKDGWHTYGLAQTEGVVRTAVDIDEWPEGLSRGALSEDPEAHEKEWFGDLYLMHEGEVTFSLVVIVAQGAKPGPRTLRGSLTAQACDESSCLPPDPMPFAVTFNVLAAGASPAVVAAAEPAATTTSTTFSGLGLTLLLQAISLGFLTVITPCVFPLLPVTVSFFAKQEGNPLPRALVYAAGIIFTIVGIGLIFQQTLDQFARGDLFNLLVGLLFFVLALSLFGLFDLRLPGFLIDASTKKSATGGLVGAFFMAVTLALTSFSCSLPFLAVMFETFDEGAVGTAVVGLTAYATAMALPFFVCSLFPALLSSLPRAGVWMNAVKVTMGFVEFGLAFKFFRTIDLNHDWGFLPRSLVLAIWVASCVGAALYLFGYLVLPHDTKVESIGVTRLLFALMFVSFAAYLLPGTFGRPLTPALDAFIQTQPEELLRSGGGGEDEHIAWVKNDWDGSLARAAEKRRPVVFDFTGVG